MYKTNSSPWPWRVDQVARGFCSHGSVLCWSKLGGGVEALVYVGVLHVCAIKITLYLLYLSC